MNIEMVQKENVLSILMKAGNENNIKPELIAADLMKFNGKEYILEESLTADVALVKAYKADKGGNLIFRKTAQNFNPVCAMAGKISIAEVEEIVEIGELDPDEIHLPGIYINRIVLNAHPEKRIEQMTLKAEA